MGDFHSRLDPLQRWRLLLPAVLCISSSAGAQAQRVYIAPDDHTDYFWSALDTTYRQKFSGMIDYYLNLADSTQNNSSDFQSRWNCDGSYWMWTYERDRSPAQFQKLISRIQDGHISVPLNALAVCLGGAPTEAILRGMYYPGRIERQYPGLRFRLASCIGNQTLPCGLGQPLGGFGREVFVEGHMRLRHGRPERARSRA